MARSLAALLAGLATATLVLAFSLIPRRGVIETADDGVWPGSWSVAYGWPSTAYYAFGYDPAMMMVAWTPEGVVKNAVLAVAVAFIVSLGVLAARPRDS